MKITVLTLFPEMFAPLKESIIGRACGKGKLDIEVVNIRDYSEDRHKKCDDYPFGGGAGMVMMPQPIGSAINAVDPEHRAHRVYMSPKGATFTQDKAFGLLKYGHLILLCGHYEGIDERVLEEIVTDSVSIGDYVLTGGELPAMVLVDAVSRMVPGVLTNDESSLAESFEGGLLEYPQYSRPEEWRGKKVPEILLSGNHRKVEEWRREQSILRTMERRPDLLASAELTEKERKITDSVKDGKNAP